MLRSTSTARTLVEDEGRRHRSTAAPASPSLANEALGSTPFGRGLVPERDRGVGVAAVGVGVAAVAAGGVAAPDPRVATAGRRIARAGVATAARVRVRRLLLLLVLDRLRVPVQEDGVAGVGVSAVAASGRA